MPTADERLRRETFMRDVGRALRCAAKVARQIARVHRTPLYVWKNGKVVAPKP